jgi:bifunctional oligoribonuclease and PAP phosphatase NrnA
VKIIERILEAIRPCASFCVAGHVRPDGDCIGSQLGLTLALRNEGKEVACWNEDTVPHKYAFLDPGGVIQKPKPGREFDCVIAVDSASYERLGQVGEQIKNRKVLLNIDHHASNTRFGDLNWVMPRAPSTGELIYQLLRQARWPITPPMADCLFTAVSTDTGSFQYATTRPTSYHVAGELVKRGANLETICREVYQSFPLSRVRLLQRVYNRFRLTDDNRIAYFWLKQADYARTGADKADSEGLIDHLRAIEPVQVACVFEEVEPEMTRVSLRSKTAAVDVNQIAALFGGGGHPGAAGARVSGRPLSVQRRVVSAIKQALARSKKQAGREQ